MIVLGSNSEVAQAFVEKALHAGEKFKTIYLFNEKCALNCFGTHTPNGVIS